MPRAVDGQLQSAINALQAKVSADPEIQAILAQNRAQLQRTRDKGGSDRDFQNRVRDQITAIAKRKGYIPRGGSYFVNPNDGQLEPHGGWAGLSGPVRTAIIAAAAAAGTLGAGALAGGFGGGAAGASGAGGVLPSGSIAGLHTAVPAAISSQGISAGIGAGLGAGAGTAGAGGLLASKAIPGLHTAVPGSIASQAASRGIGAGIGGVAGLGKKLLGNLTSGPGIASLAGIIPALLSGRGGGGDSSGQNQDFINRAYEDAKRQNLMQQARYRRVDPLHEAVTQLAFSRLPTSAQHGITVPRVPLPE